MNDIDSDKTLLDNRVRHLLQMESQMQKKIEKARKDAEKAERRKLINNEKLERRFLLLEQKHLDANNKQ